MEKQKSYDPNAAISADFGIFGLPVQESAAKVVLVPVPWEVTTSYGAGASWGPQLIRKASEQIDLFDFETGKAYELGYFMRAFPTDLKKSNDDFKVKAQELIKMINEQSSDQKRMDQLRSEVNTACEKMNEWVYKNCKEVLVNGQGLGVVGGDHSTPFGALRAISESCQGQFGILHIDAHADLRKAYQGFTHSHASIMNNVMNAPWKPTKLVQVGIRDFCEEEFDLIESRDDIRTFFDLDLKSRMFEGTTWKDLCEDIVSELPQNVYISFDIDGLDPSFCPHTGTPVPGGLQMEQMYYLFNHLYRSGRNIIGFDVNEVSSGGVAPKDADPWDGNVGARVLYKLCGWLALSRKRIQEKG